MTDGRRFAFLALEEHPWGREMLSQLLAAGHTPLSIVEETGELASIEREKFLRRIGGHPVAPPIGVQADEAGIPLSKVERHDGAAGLSLLSELQPDLIVLGGTRIVRGDLLRSAPDGVLNSHPGLLPECRGSASPAWSVLHDIPIGASCHFCTEEIDRGDVVGRRRIDVRRGDTYEDLCYRTLTMGATLMAEALDAWVAGRLETLRSPQGESPHPTFRNMPDELLSEVHRKLAAQSYGHYTD